MEPLLNTRITMLKESSTLAINTRVRAMRAAGETVFHFGFGESPFPVHPLIQEALRANAQRSEYLPTLGLPALREAICAFYARHHGYAFDPAAVSIGPGSKELLFQALLILEGPLLIPAPSWVSYGPQAQIRGKDVREIQTRKANGWKLQADELEATCTALAEEPQKLLIINSPNNPTGAVYSDAELGALAAVCKRHGVLVISDEIYALVDFSGNPYRGFSAHYPEGTLVTGGLSKGYSAGGYRLGFLAAPAHMQDMLNALSALTSETFSAVSAPTQYAALAAFSDDADLLEYVAICRSIHQAAGTYLHARLRAMGVGCVPPEGAFYLFPDFETQAPALRARGIDGSTQLCNWLLNEAAVATLPGSDFYCEDALLACRMATVDYDGERVLAAARAAGNVDGDFVSAHCPNLVQGCDSLETLLGTLA
ncbi:MAG: aminotransferase class I/II-fold pyridoxal phosphate-dependent enzyme [Pseudomonadota bacterium]